MLQGLTHYGDMITVLGWDDLGEKEGPVLGSSIYRVIGVLGRSAMAVTNTPPTPAFDLSISFAVFFPAPKHQPCSSLLLKSFHPRRLMQKTHGHLSY